MIIKKINSFRFSIEWKTEHPNLPIFSNILQKSLLLTDFRKNNEREFSFLAEQVEYFLPFCFEQKAYNNVKGDLSYSQVTNLVDSLVKLIVFLEQKGYTFSQIDLEKIIVIDKCFFLYLGIEKLCFIDNKQIKITNCSSYNPLGSPEWITQKRLPSFFSYKIVYYNIAMLAGYCLFFHLHNLGEREEEEEGKEDISQSHLLNLFETHFPSTKLTFFFKTNTSSFPFLLF
jgi:hypothetical protein